MRRATSLLALIVAVAAVPSAHAGTATDEMAACAALGAKRPGNAAGRAMADHLEQRFRAAGLDTRVERFHMPVYQVDGVALQVVSPEPRTVPGETFAYGGTGTVQAEVVDVGTGRASDYEGKDAKGKIVMVDRNEAFHRTAQLTQVLEHGGVAMLYVSGSPDNLIQTGAVRFAQAPPASIPTVTVGADDGKALRATMKSGPMTMRIAVDAERVDAVARNVIGIRKGTTHPDRYVVAAGHYDSWHGGAVDNCSSMGSLLEVIDATKAAPPAYTTIFAAWDAEEPGLVGSYDWAMRHLAQVPAIVMDENFEMTSAASYVGDQRLDYSAVNLLFGTTSPAMNALTYQAAARNAFVPAPTTANGVRSISGGIIPTDLQPFYALGVQGFSTFSSTPYYHTTKDDADKIDPASLERVTGMLRDVLTDVQRVPPESLALREVPTVTLSAPGTAAPGATVPVQIRLVDPTGAPVTGVPVRVLVDQRNHWAVAEGPAKEVGGGVYRYEVPAGVTEADLTSLQATVDQATYMAQGFARVDQRRGGPLAAGRECWTPTRRSARVQPGFRLLSARASAGKVRVRGRHIALDLRGTSRSSVRLVVRARDAAGRTVRQTRTYFACQQRLPG
jgi:aminopeptidase YwaD